MARKKAAKKKSDVKETVEDESSARMFEFRGGTSDKFWTIERSGNFHTVRYGRVGTDGQTRTKEFPNTAKADASYEKLIAQKVGKGYVELADEASSRSGSIKLNRAQSKEREPFLQQILDAADEPSAYFVFADWLEEQDDPQGELIRIQWQLEDESIKLAARKKLQQREKALIAEHGQAWLGELAEDLTNDNEPEGVRWGDGALYEWQFGRGFVDRLTIEYLYPDFAKSLGHSELAKTLRYMLIRNPSNGSSLAESPEYADKNWSYEDTPGLDALIGGEFPNLRHLVISEGSSCHISAPNLHKVVKTMPQLETLEVEAHGVETTQLFKIKLPELRSLTIHHLHDYDLVALAKNKSLTKLESVYFWPHALEPGDESAYITAEGFTALCHAKHLANLKHVRLWSTSIGNEGIAQLVQSPLLKQLKTLDLNYGSITDEGANLLADADLSGLELLDVSSNFISDDGLERLRSNCPAFKSATQFGGEPDDEMEYLFYGDME